VYCSWTNYLLFHSSQLRLIHISSPEDRITSIKHCAPRISSKLATIDEFVLKNIGLWWRYGISRHCDECKYIIIGRIFESEIILIQLIRGAQCLIEVIRSSGEEMWRVDAYQIPYYSRGIEGEKRTRPRLLTVLCTFLILLQCVRDPTASYADSIKCDTITKQNYCD
jgi:hypothetical protein